MGACEEFEERISAFIDGQLPPEEREALMEHMADCLDCQAYFDDQIAIQDALDRAGVQAPEGFAEDVMAQVRRTRQERPARGRRRFSLRSWQSWAGLAACCAVVLIGVWSFRGQVGRADQASQSVRGTVRSAEPEMALSDGFAAEEAGEEPDGEEQAASPYGAENDSVSAAAFPTEEEAKQQECALFGNTAMDEAERTLAAGILHTASPLAQDWLSETLGADWVSGGVRELSREEYEALRELLSGAGEAFREEAGSPEATGWLLAME